MVESITKIQIIPTALAGPCTKGSSAGNQSKKAQEEEHLSHSAVSPKLSSAFR